MGSVVGVVLTDVLVLGGEIGEAVRISTSDL